MKLLITGFEPFLGEKINPSQLLALEIEKSASRELAGFEIQSLILPVEYEQSFAVLQKKLEQQDYDFLLMLGQAASRDSICLEKVALNLADSAFADSAGLLLQEQKIVESGAEAYFSTLPLRQICQSLCMKGHKVRVSTTAGTYVCNDLYYRSFLWQRSLQKSTEVLFVHVPYEESQVENKPGIFAMGLNDMKKTLLDLIRELTQCRACGAIR